MTFEHLPPPAEVRTIPPDTALFYMGDQPDTLYRLEGGVLEISTGRDDIQPLPPGEWVDPVATLGGLPHRCKALAVTSCQVACWPLDTLLVQADFAAEVQGWLASRLEASESRLKEVLTLPHYQNHRADLMPGPFRFEDVVLLFSFCDAEKSALENLLPPGLTLLQRPGRTHGTVLVVYGDFPYCVYEHTPDVRFAYNETTVFIPVRYKTAWGLYVLYIYPSTYEPLLLGHEIYGFPKRIGYTRFSGQAVHLEVGQQPVSTLTWEHSTGVSERRLVRAFSDALGIMGQATAIAFEAGEVLRRMARLPARRRVDIYNHRRILAADATVDNAHYAIDELTRSTFGVLGWEQIARLENPQLTVQGGALAELNLTLREAYRTVVNMRLSTGRVMQDYRTDPPE